MVRTRSVTRTRSELPAGRVLAESVRVIARNAGAFSVLALIAFLPLTPLLLWRVMLHLDGEQLPEDTEMLETIVSLVCQWTLATFVVRGTYESVRGRRTTLGAMLNHGVSRLLPALGAATLTALLMGGAAFAILVPAMCGAVAAAASLGVYVAIIATIIAVIVALVILCRLWVAVPAIVVERCGVIRSLKRSATLTEGVRWRVFAVVFVVQLCSVIAGAVLTGLSAATEIHIAVQVTLELVVTVAFGTWSAVAAVVGYYELRRTREGLDLDELAAVFE